MKNEKSNKHVEEAAEAAPIPDAESKRSFTQRTFEEFKKNGYEGFYELFQSFNKDPTLPEQLVGPPEEATEVPELMQRYEKVFLSCLNWRETFKPIREVLPNLVSDDVDGDALIPTRIVQVQKEALESEFLRNGLTPEDIEHLRLYILEKNNLLQSGKDITTTVPERIRQGKFCQQVIEEIKRIRNSCMGTGRSMAEIENENPNFAVWKVRAALCAEDQETFNHPNRWGPVVGYALGLLSKEYSRSPATIRDWIKAYRSSMRPPSASSH